MVNAFWLDRDLDSAVRWLVDSHVTSSILECSMVLTTAVQANGFDAPDLPFTHEHHPLTTWATESYRNWRRLHDYTDRTHDEWRYRYDHGPEEVHGSWEAVAALDDDAVRDLDWPESNRTDPPQVTGDWAAEDYVDAYRLYYANEKRHLFAWTKRTRPPWIEEYTFPDGPGSHTY